MAFAPTKFIHEKYLHENPEIKVSELSPELQKKIQSWKEAKAVTYKNLKREKRQESLDKLGLLSNELMKDISAELDEKDDAAAQAAAAATSAASTAPATPPDDTAGAGAVVKKKSNWGVGLFLVGLTVVLGAIGISQAVKPKE